MNEKVKYPKHDTGGGPCNCSAVASPVERVVMPVLHLKTQDDQPYGSVRRCCEECGKMIWGDSLPENHKWTDDRIAYRNAISHGYVRCVDVKA